MWTGNWGGKGGKKKLLRIFHSVLTMRPTLVRLTRDPGRKGRAMAERRPAGKSKTPDWRQMWRRLSLQDWANHLVRKPLL